MTYIWHWTIALIVFAVLLPCVPYRLARGALRKGRHLAERMARRPVLTATLLGLLSFGTDVVFQTVAGGPTAPIIHDEFAYILAGDTFAHGRLTNPTPRHAERFDSFHLVVRPTYQSKYPPLQGVFLAIGQVLTGEQITGVWLSRALAVGALFWMLLAWTSPLWALVGAILFALDNSAISWWGHSYWGGAVAFWGGALVFGALKRQTQQPRWTTGLILGLGYAVLANTRPVEGFLAAICSLVMLVVGLRTRHPLHWKKDLMQTVAAVLLVLVPTAGMMLRYNAAVTGDMKDHPYLLWARQQDQSGPIDVADSLFPAPQLAEEQLPRYVQMAREQRGSVPGRITNTPLMFAIKLFGFQVSFYLPGVLMCTLAGIALVLDRRDVQSAIMTVGLLILFIMTNNQPGYPHYTAPVGCLMFFLVVTGLRRMSVGSQLFQKAAVITPVIALGTFLAMTVDYEIPQNVGRPTVKVNRQAVVDYLADIPGKHLLLVTYVDGHIVHNEYVYNLADPESQRILWARSFSDAEDRAFVADYADRTAWKLFVRNGALWIIPFGDYMQNPISRSEAETELKPFATGLFVGEEPSPSGGQRGGEHGDNRGGQEVRRSTADDLSSEFRVSSVSARAEQPMWRDELDSTESGRAVR